MDSAVMPSKKYAGMKLVSTTDFFYPNVVNPHNQGRIACANVLSDLYAMGVFEVDSMLMILAASRDMTPNDRHIATKMMIRGFEEKAREANASVNGGQTVLNPWPIIGGVAMTICRDEDILMPIHAKAGDVLVLTKPLGTQIAVNCKQWLAQERWKKYEHLLTVDQVERAFALAEQSMMRLNRNGARLMMKYSAHAATDVTGFGLIGHGDNLVKNQSAHVSFIIHTLPIIADMALMDKHTNFRLLQGYSAETSGGLLVAMERESAEKFLKELREVDGDLWKGMGWIVGDVVKCDEKEERRVNILQNATIIEV